MWLLLSSLPLFEVFCCEKVFVRRIKTICVIYFISDALHILVVIVQIIVHFIAIRPRHHALVFLLLSDLQIGLIVHLELPHFDLAFAIFVVR